MERFLKHIHLFIPILCLRKNLNIVLRGRITKQDDASIKENMKKFWSYSHLAFSLAGGTGVENGCRDCLYMKDSKWPCSRLIRRVQLPLGQLYSIKAHFPTSNSTTYTQYKESKYLIIKATTQFWILCKGHFFPTL